MTEELLEIHLVDKLFDQLHSEDAQEVYDAAYELGWIQKTSRVSGRYDQEEVIKERLMTVFRQEGQVVGNPTIFTAKLIEDQNGENWPQRQAAVFVLGRLRNPQAMPALTDRLRDSHFFVFQFVEEAILNMGDAAVSHLIQTLEEPMPHELARSRAARLLGDLKATSAFPILTKVLQEDDSIWVRSSAADALGTIGDPQAIPLLTSSLKTDQEWSVRHAAASALKHLKWQPPTDSDTAYYLVARDSYIQGYWHWDEVIRLGDAAVPPLVEALQDTSPHNKYTTAEALAEAGKSQAVPILLERLNGSRRVIDRYAMARALTKVDYSDVNWEDQVEIEGTYSPEADVARRLLVNSLTRPDPLEVVKFDEMEILQGAADAGFSIPKMPLTLYELENALPYTQQIVEHLLQVYGDHRILVLGRGAEIFYDALRVVLARTPLVDHVKLFPASMEFLTDLSSIPESSNEGIRAFFSSHELNEEVVTSGSNFLLLDTGFKGRAAKSIRDLLTRVYPDHADLILNNFITKLIHGNFPLMQFTEVDEGELVRLFPRTVGVFPQEFPNPRPKLSSCLAVLFELMPHYFGQYTMQRTSTGNIGTVSKEGVTKKIDRPRVPNASIVHPVAAMIVQHRVASYFEEVRDVIFSDPKINEHVV